MTIFLIFLVLASSVDSKGGGTYFAEPNYIINFPNEYPDIVESYFYLQQTGKWTVRFNGEIHVKKPFGPMMGQLDILSWTGRSFKKPSGGPANDVNQSICKIPGILQYLATMQPESGFDTEACTFAPGNYSSSLDYNEHLHEATENFPYEPIRIALKISSGNKSLFGFILEIEFQELDLYNFIPKD